MKECADCKRLLPLDRFGLREDLGPGRVRNSCKECRVAYQARHRDTKRGRELDRKRKTKWRAKNHDKSTAHHRFHTAMKQGLIDAAPCEICGAEIAEAHHEDYSKPLDVIWLCRRHHLERHRELKTSKSLPNERGIFP